MAQPAFQGLAALNFPELHEESIPELNFFRACAKMMHVCACTSLAMGAGVGGYGVESGSRCLEHKVDDGRAPPPPPHLLSQP